MSENIISMIQVTPIGDNVDQVNNMMPESLTTEDVNRIALAINSITEQLQLNVEQKVEEDKKRQIQLDEIEVNFGIDISAKTKIPIISTIFGTQMEAGATFQIKVKLKKL